MKKNFYLLLVCFFAYCISAFAQTVTLTFTAKDAANHRVQLNRVSITNLTKGWQETIYWPDTILTMQEGTGINGYTQTNGFALSQNNPNPFNGKTEVSLMVAKEGEVGLQIADVNGKIIEAQNFASLQPGIHQFRLALSTAGTYIMTARQNGQSSSIKMVCNGGGNGNKIEYTGSVLANDYSLKPTKSNPKGTTTNPFNLSDQMEYVGYAFINGAEEESEHITQTQQASEAIVLLFDAEQTDALPCPGTPTVTDYDGNIYNTVQIGTQCWMKENLRTTCYANGVSIPLGSTYSQTDPYRYVPDSNTANISTYGYLYNWPAVMGNSSSSSANPSGVQGICPNGWHVPSDSEWTQLDNYVKGQNQYVCANDTDWDDDEHLSYERIFIYTAKSLASENGWRDCDDCDDYVCAVGYNQSSNNVTGFSALPAGTYWNHSTAFSSYADFWCATDFDFERAIIHELMYYHAEINNDLVHYKRMGCSVRCVRD